jgi:hypothetical protein
MITLMKLGGIKSRVSAKRIFLTSDGRIALCIK